MSRSHVRRTSTDAHAVGFLLAHFQHLFVDVTDHSFGLQGPLLVLCGVVYRNVLPRRRLHGPRRTPLLPLLLRTNVLQETEGNVTCAGQLSQKKKVRCDTNWGFSYFTEMHINCFTCSPCHIQESHPRLWVHDVQQHVLPQSMNPQTHGIVHYVILLCHILKHLIH